MSKKKARVSALEVSSKPVLSSSAQNGTLCGDCSRSELLCTEVAAKIEKLRLRNYDLYVFATIQFRNALRVSELLNCTYLDVDVMGRLKISALKGSNHRVCDLGEFKGYILGKVQNQGTIWSSLNRFYVHREYLRVGLQLTIQGGVKRSVTHSLRHLSTQLLDDKTDGSVFAQGLLGHKDSKNTEVYVKTKSASLLSKERSTSAKK